MSVFVYAKTFIGFLSAYADYPFRRFFCAKGRTMKHVLSIAGSDSSGGAGIQADLKTMCALGVYGMTAITALTAQNTRGVYRVQEIEPGMVAAQIEAVFTDIRVDAVKIGMVSSEEIIGTIRDCLLRFKAQNIVIDPVMVAKSGDPLLRPGAERAVRDFAALADILTPNIPEAELLSGMTIRTGEDMLRAAEKLAARDGTSRGPRHILIKGGHRLENGAEDLFYSGGRVLRLPAKRIETRHTHGTGCTLSTAIACRLALGDSPEEAVRAAKDYITRAIRDAYALGGGSGPVGHLADLYRRAGMEAPE
jgi:hydroxymethylpyrimidine/phosphomethylpyrimidine kinase